MVSITLLITVLFIGTAVAFHAPLSSRFSTQKNALYMSADKPTATAKIATGLLAFFAMTASPIHVQAANYGGFGSTYAEVIDPKDAVLSDDANPEDVKAGYAALQDFSKSVASIKADLAKDSQTELNKRVKSELPINKVRGALNKYNSAFGEDTQRGTDRLIRAVVQDLTELDRETVIKPGKARSDQKVKNINKRLTAAGDALGQLEAFYKK